MQGGGLPVATPSRVTTKCHTGRVTGQQSHLTAHRTDGKYVLKLHPGQATDESHVHTSILYASAYA